MHKHKDTQSQLEILFASAPVGIAQLDSDLKFVRVNSALAEINGTTVSDHIGRSVWDIVPARRREMEPRLLRVLSAGETIQAEISGKTLANPHLLRTWKARYYPLRSQDGAIFGIGAIVEDITEKKIAETALRDSEELFRGVFEQSTVGITILEPNPGGRFLRVNDRACAIFGKDRADFAGLRLHDIAQVRPGVVSADDPVTAIGVDRSRERQFVKADGSIGWAEVALSVVRDGAREPMCVVGVSVDVTQRHVAEAALAERSRDLEIARDDALNANAAKSRFMAAANHDLRQPLHAASLYLAALERRLSARPELDIVQKASEALEVMSDILKSLLDVSKFEGGAVRPEPRAFPVQDLLDRLVSQFAFKAEEKGLRFVCNPSACVVYSDPGLLERVIDNFVSNAIRYTENGQVTVECQDQGNVVRFCVADTGPGIPGAALESIFDEYVQLDNVARSRSQGLGLGLAIAKHISTLLGCSISVQSTIGVGSTFSIEAPIGQSALSASPVHVSRPLNRTAHDDKGLSVLFIDDDQQITTAMLMVLGDEGFHVRAARDGTEALAILASGYRPDLIVSDYRLPSYNGVEVVRRTRGALDATTPAILLTGDSVLNDDDIASLGQCAVLHKPIRAEALISLIRQLAG